MSIPQGNPYEGDPTQLAVRIGGISMREDGYPSPQRPLNQMQNPANISPHDYNSLSTPTGRAPPPPLPPAPYGDQRFQYYTPNLQQTDPGYGDAGMSLIDPASFAYGTATLAEIPSTPMTATGSYNAYPPSIEAYNTQSNLAPIPRAPYNGADSSSLVQSTPMMRQSYRRPHMQQQQPGSQQQVAYQQQQANATAMTGFYNLQDQNTYWIGQSQPMYLSQSDNTPRSENQHNDFFQPRRQQSSTVMRPTRHNGPNNFAYKSYAPSTSNGNITHPLPMTPYHGNNNGSTLPFNIHQGAQYGGLSGYGNGTQRGVGLMLRSRRLDMSGTIRSALLEDFRLNKLKRWQLSDVFGHIVEFASDQHGSRFIQQRLEQANEEERERLFDEIMPHAFQVMTDVFGNYFTQKMFEEGTEAQKLALAKKMEGRVVQLSTHMYGCRVVQKALENLAPATRIPLISELEPHILVCVKSSNANHVIQRLIALGPPQSIPDAFIGHVEELSKHPYGCRVLQKTFEYLDHQMAKPLVAEVQKHTLELMRDQFGNYVLQSVILTTTDEERTKILNDIKGNIVSLARHKFASNVLEKAINAASAEDRHAIIAELVGVQADGTNNVATLLRDAYGNFPLQTAMLAAEPVQRQQIVDLINPILPSIRHTPVGKRIESRLGQLQVNTGGGNFDTGLRMSISSSATSDTNGLSMSRTTSSSTGPTSPEPNGSLNTSTSTARGSNSPSRKLLNSPQAQESSNDAQALVDLLQ